MSYTVGGGLRQAALRARSGGTRLVMAWQGERDRACESKLLQPSLGKLPTLVAGDVDLNQRQSRPRAPDFTGEPELPL
jgi:hypothetical protein